MSLIATARALDDARFRWRVNAAVLTTAAEKINEPEGISRSFAEYVLDNPMRESKTVVALVACNAAISNAVTVDSFNTVNTESVTDSDILYVVGSVWDTLAGRWDELSQPEKISAAIAAESAVARSE